LEEKIKIQNNQTANFLEFYQQNLVLDCDWYFDGLLITKERK